MKLGKLDTSLSSNTQLTRPHQALRPKMGQLQYGTSVTINACLMTCDPRHYAMLAILCLQLLGR